MKRVLLTAMLFCALGAMTITAQNQDKKVCDKKETCTKTDKQATCQQVEKQENKEVKADKKASGGCCGSTAKKADTKTADAKKADADKAASIRTLQQADSKSECQAKDRCTNPCKQATK